MFQGIPGNSLMAAVQQIMANRQGQQPQQQPSRSPFGTQLMQALMRLQQQGQQPKQRQWPGAQPGIPGYKLGQQMMQPGAGGIGYQNGQAQQPPLGGARASGMIYQSPYQQL